MSAADQMALLAPRQTAGAAPFRVAGAVRRTSTIDASWPDGAWADMLFTARARDVHTPRDGGAPLVCAEDGFVAVVGQDRTILDIRIEPARPAERQLIGQRGGGHLRHALEEIMPEERAHGTLSRLVGEPLADLRQLVLERLRGTAGCTHLNDALRALAEVPHLVALLDRP